MLTALANLIRSAWPFGESVQLGTQWPQRFVFRFDSYSIITPFRALLRPNARLTCWAVRWAHLAGFRTEELRHMAHLPPCGEGWRRLAIVIAIAALIVAAGLQIHRYRRPVTSSEEQCYERWRGAANWCVASDRIRNCVNDLNSELSVCLTASQRAPENPYPLSFAQGLCAVGLAIGSYLLTLIIGWVSEGFRAASGILRPKGS
jgi:hypothetical protein